MTLLIDVGNTTTEIKYFNNQIKLLFSESTKCKIKNEDIKQVIDTNNILVNKIIYSSVVPEKYYEVVELAKYLNIPLINIRESNFLNSKDFNVKNIDGLGEDLIANFYGANKCHNIKNGIFISLGTATTISLIQKDIFIGTIISPGLQSSLKNLIRKASLLEDLKYSWTEEIIGITTLNSISIGAIKGHYKMILGLIEDIKQKYNIETIIFTGGNANYFLNNIEYEIDLNLIFKGLDYLAK